MRLFRAAAAAPHATQRNPNRLKNDLINIRLRLHHIANSWCFISLFIHLPFLLASRIIRKMSGNKKNQPKKNKVDKKQFEEVLSQLNSESKAIEQAAVQSKNCS